MPKTVGVREFRDNATRYLASNDVLRIERHGNLVGYFVPVEPPKDDPIETAVTKLRADHAEDVMVALRERRPEVLAACVRHGASNVRVFGSVARGETTRQSDVDLLVDFDADRTLLDQAGLVEELSELLGRSVDVVTERGLRPTMRASVLSEARPL